MCGPACLALSVRRRVARSITRSVPVATGLWPVRLDAAFTTAHPPSPSFLLRTRLRRDKPAWRAKRTARWSGLARRWRPVYIAE